MAEPETTTTPVETATPPAVEPATATEPPRSSTPDTSAVETPATPAWYHILPEEYREKGYVKAHGTFDDFLKHVDGWERTRGRAVILPEDPNDPLYEQKAQQAYRQLGAPESADAYQFDIPEGAPVNPNALDAFRASALDAGLNQKQVDVIYKRQLEAARLQNEAAKAEEARLEQEMIENWSRPVYEHKLGQALELADHYGIRDLVEKTRLHRIARWVESFSDMRDALRVEGIMPQGSPSGYTREGVNSELRQLKTSEAYMDRSHPENKAITDRVRQLEHMRAVLNSSR